MSAPSSQPIPLLRPVSSVSRTIRTRPQPIAVQGTLALQWQLPGEIDAVPAAPATLRLVERLGTGDVDPAVAEIPTPRADLPDPGPWVGQLVQAVLEVLAQERPRQQLVRWLTPRVYSELSTQVLAATRRPQAGQRTRPAVTSVHLFEPADGVVEASAVVVGGRRARALALRLEGWDGRWRCTQLALL
jgi:hypothetical protein